MVKSIELKGKHVIAKS